MPASTAPPDEACDPWLPDDGDCDDGDCDDGDCDDGDCDDGDCDDGDCDDEDCEDELGGCCGVVQAAVRPASSKHVVQRAAIERLTKTAE
jgi:hypothetical protein